MCISYLLIINKELQNCHNRGIHETMFFFNAINIHTKDGDEQMWAKNKVRKSKNAQNLNKAPVLLNASGIHETS